MATMDGNTPPTLSSTSNPLLMEDFLQKLFPYFEDGRTLASIREVCKTWYRESALTLKKNMRWRIGPYRNSEEHFFKDMVASMTDEERSRIFRNFNFYHRKSFWSTVRVSGSTDRFLQEFGPCIVDLQLKSRNVAYVLAHFKASFLQNLEKLELYDMSPALLQIKTLFGKDGHDDCFPVFPKLKSLCFNPDIHRWSEYEEYNEGEAKICFNLLRACPALKELEINLKKTTSKILCDESIDLSGLRSFKTELKEEEDQDDLPPNVVFKQEDFANLRKKCPNLKVLALTFTNEATKVEICEMLSKYACQLEELHVSMADLDSYENFVASEDSEDEVLEPVWPVSSSEEDEEAEEPGLKEQVEAMRLVYHVNLKRRQPERRSPSPCQPESKMPKIAFPDFPLLKKLRWLSWFYTDLDSLGSMPALKEVNLKMQEGVTFGPAPEHVSAANYPTVTCLRFRGGTRHIFLGGSGSSRLKRFQIVPLIAMFPNVAELDVELGNDEALRTVISTLHGTLKRLHLNDSTITDDGITGIPWSEEPEEVKKTYNNKTWSDEAKEDIITANRQFPFIGDLKGLQEFTYTEFGLTNLSVEFGFIYVTNLTSLKLPPNKKLSSECPPSYFEKFDFDRTDVSVRPLVDNLKYLVKLDVNDDSNISSKDRAWKENKDDEDEHPPNRYKYTSCGISSDDLAYIKERAPSLEIVYGELKEKLNSQITNTRDGGESDSDTSDSDFHPTSSSSTSETSDDDDAEMRRVEELKFFYSQIYRDNCRDFRH